MKPSHYKILAIVFFSAIVLQSCAEDDPTEIDDADTVVAEDIGVSNATTQLIVDWSDLWLELDRYAYGMRPTATARALAYINLAAYETAVTEMDSYVSNRNRLQGFNINFNQLEEDINLDLALNTCYALVMDHFMYNIDASVDTKIAQFQSNKNTELSEGLSTSEVENSIDWGTYVANRVIAYSQSDTAAEAQILNPQPYAYEPPTGDGFWTYSADEERAWYPYWGTARTFVISSDQTSSVPPSLTYSETVGSAYYEEMEEVYTLNNAAKEEDNEDLWIAEFWSDDVEGLMMSPPGRQISIAKQLIEKNDLGFENSLALLLKLSFSLNDAAVSAWADKYEYMVMRPSVYIQEHMDSEFQTNLYRLVYWPNPSFPGYPSGHSAFSSAAAGVFINEFGNAIDFTDRSHEGRTEFKGTPRQYDSFTAMAEENAFSRIPLGVHIRMDCTEGIRLGYEISDAVNNYDLSN